MQKIEAQVFSKIPIKTNYFRFRCEIPILKYKISTEPQIPSNQVGLLYKILSLLRETLSKLMNPYQPFNFTIYSPNQIDETVLVVDYENVRYSVKIEPTGLLELTGEDKEALVFMGRFFKLLQSQLKFKQIGRKYFNDKVPEDFPKWKLTVWPGYQTSLNQYQTKILVNIDTCFKVLRETTVYEFIESLMSKYNGDQERVKDEIINTTVMTRYNHAMYKIEDISFQMSPKDKFKVKAKDGDGDDDEISYAEYYEKKYNKKLRYPEQPLLIHIRRKDGSAIHLMPELCVLTGQSMEMRQNFQLQKDLNTLIKPAPQKRLNESKRLLEILAKNEQTRDLMKKWSIAIDLDPLKIEGEKIDAGNIIMGKNNLFSLEETPDFDRRIQSEMLEQPRIRKIGVFYNKRDKEACKAFMDTLKKCVETFNYPMDQPKEFAVDGKGFEDWEYVFQKNLDHSVQAVILLLPGKKKSSPYYDSCKHYLLTKCPIPSQVILIPTITTGKNLRSIVNKILIQICAKVGGTPWSITNFPFIDKPTMIVGIDVFHQASMKGNSLLAYCATVNRHFSRYWSTVNVHPTGEERGSGIQTAVKNSILAFAETNRGVFPGRIVVYRDGVSDSQRKTLTEIEVKAFLRAFEDLKLEHGMTVKPQLLFVCVNKRLAVKFFSGDNLEKGGLANPSQGTIVSGEITSGRDFYLISQKSQQGSVSPTHYFVLGYYTNINEEYVEVADAIPEDIFKNIQVLTYKLCYMYFNWSGSIKVPAPIQYAQKLSNLIGERWRPNNPMIPHKNFEKYKSLYFI